MSERTFVLVGTHAGKTVKLGSQFQYVFIKGKMKIIDDAEIIDKVARYVRSYSAFIEGSPEHLAAVKHIEKGKSDVVGDIQTTTGTGDSNADGSGTPSTVKGSSNEDTVDSNTDGDAKSSDTELRTDGDRPSTKMIVEALQSLDADNDEHWTNGGEPRVSMVNQILNSEIGRSEIHSALPGFNREAAR